MTDLVELARPVLGYTAIEIVAHAHTPAHAAKTLRTQIGGSHHGHSGPAVHLDCDAKGILVRPRDRHIPAGTVTWRQAADRLAPALTPGICAQLTQIAAAWANLNSHNVNAIHDRLAWETWWRPTYHRIAEARRAVIAAVWDEQPAELGQLTLAVAS